MLVKYQIRLDTCIQITLVSALIFHHQINIEIESEWLQHPCKDGVTIVDCGIHFERNTPKSRIPSEEGTE